MIAEFAAMAYSAEVIRPIYVAVRTALAISLFWLAPRVIRSVDSMISVVRAATLGVGLTVTLMILSSLPFTKGLVATTVFSIPYLEPAAQSTVAHYTSFIETATRGRSLVGVSILSGAFINTFWPLIALSVRLPYLSQRWRNVGRAVVLAAPFGILASYSRGAILGLVLVVGGSLFFGSSRSRRGIIVAVLLASTVITVVGWDSDLFYFDRVVERTEAALTNPYEDARETERLFAYVEPFAHLVQHPQFLLFGEGASIGKTGARSHQAGQATHAVFAQAYYSYGLLAAVLYVFLVAAAFRFLLAKIRHYRHQPVYCALFYQALFAGLLGMLPWLVFGHAAVSQPRGAMLFFLFFGLIVAVRNIEVSERWAIACERDSG
jgi:hypothetical protein